MVGVADVLAVRVGALIHQLLPRGRGAVLAQRGGHSLQFRTHGDGTAEAPACDVGLAACARGGREW